MAEFELTGLTIVEHARALSGVAQAVRGAATAGTARVGLLDFGTLFAATLAPAVNAALGSVGDAVRRHGHEVEQHRTEFVRTAAVLVEADEVAAGAVPKP